MQRFSDRARALIEEYGSLGLVVWFAVFGLNLAVAAVVIELGLDWPWLESHVGSASTFAGAYLIAKLLMPARVALVAALLPLAARVRRRLIGDPTVT
ncbi:MAG: hypothetical protein EXR71_11625 [Myxococcales bacterium]|nr:hypothetical protein [Myxococcales bacterium]